MTNETNGIAAEAPKEPIYKVLQKDVDNAIVLEQYLRGGHKTVICVLVLTSGFEVVGTSGVVDPKEYDFAIGKEEAKKNAVNKVWEHLGGILQWTRAIDIQEKQRVANEVAAAKAREAGPADTAPDQPPTPVAMPNAAQTVDATPVMPKV